MFEKSKLVHSVKDIRDVLKLYDQSPTASIQKQKDIISYLPAAFSAPSYRIEYHSNQEFESLASDFHVMSDIRAKTARVSYYGVVTFWIDKKIIVHLAPTKGFSLM